MAQQNELALRTRVLHVGEEPDPTTKAVEAPLILSTNFVTDPDSSGFSAVDLKDGDPYLYARWSTPTVRGLEEKLANLEEGEDALCFASGMAAAAGLLLGTLKSVITLFSAMSATPVLQNWDATRCPVLVFR